jgi:hypothetical protein
MSRKDIGRKVYKSMQGKQVDMDLLRKRNELTPAVGNARVNARGDELGPGGKIVKKREDVINEYYRQNPYTVVDEEPVKPDTSKTPATNEPVAMEKSSTTKKTTRAQEAVEAVEDIEWVEDEDGNFIPKEG